MEGAQEEQTTLTDITNKSTQEQQTTQTNLTKESTQPPAFRFCCQTQPPHGEEWREIESDSEGVEMEDDSEDEFETELHEDHMFLLASRQYEEMLEKSSDTKLLMRYANMIISRVASNSSKRDFPEHTSLFLHKAELLLQKIVFQDASMANEVTPLFNQINSLKKGKKFCGQSEKSENQP
eukprot:CAMPEP_0174269852 /NCGR_PEP_ID=MMETSP0439-20130205/42521_1 /TAXON_ID=0 /ORGANISM="Stereomyxa ramosa, Strain Chinc5" /LENGTH=179 /DNA_ID=CAMNT_0015358833 /DNA_START=35 /DNA_END=570 /DNA_ORIENTATION=+